MGLVTAIACYVVGLAWWQSLNHNLYDFDDLIVPRMIDVVIVMWLLWIGSSIGSFLNVVAWRMPRGESLNGRSKCPRCETRLRAKDNFPVFGWLALGGRCRTCRLPISARYPIVEAAVGLSVTAVGVTELYRLALPYQTNHWHGGPLWTPIIDRPMLIVLLYHIVALSCSWACGLIRTDGNRLPWQLKAFAAMAATFPLLVYPDVMTVPWQSSTPPHWPPIEVAAQAAPPSVPRYLNAVMRIITAIAAAGILGRIMGRVMCPAADPKIDPLGSDTRKLIDLLLIAAIPSVVVGWQSTPALLLFAAIIALLFRSSGMLAAKDALGYFAIAVPIALTIHLISWRWMHEQPFLPGIDREPWVFLAYAAALLFVCLWFKDDGQKTMCEHAAEEPVRSFADPGPSDSEDEPIDFDESLS